MNDTILKIGNVDMSEHVICEAVDISTAPVYSDSFTAVNGKERKKCLGVSVSLSADFQVCLYLTTARWTITTYPYL